MTNNQQTLPDNISINKYQTAAVNKDTPWLNIADVPPPLGVKLLLITKGVGVTVLGNYSDRFGWTHWQGLPTFKDG